MQTAGRIETERERESFGVSRRHNREAVGPMLLFAWTSPHGSSMVSSRAVDVAVPIRREAENGSTPSLV